MCDVNYRPIVHLEVVVDRHAELALDKAEPALEEGELADGLHQLRHPHPPHLHQSLLYWILLYVPGMVPPVIFRGLSLYRDCPGKSKRGSEGYQLVALLLMNSRMVSKYFF